MFSSVLAYEQNLVSCSAKFLTKIVVDNSLGDNWSDTYVLSAIMKLFFNQDQT